MNTPAVEGWDIIWWIKMFERLELKNVWGIIGKLNFNIIWELI
jgi:hypothetical protein